MKRLFDFIASFIGLTLLFPVLAIFLFLVWLQDFHSPFYIAPRVGRNGKMFRMIKVRSMIIRADKSGVDSTAANDNRITRVGAIIRRYKIDELSQLINVLIGDMSLVGPRPNVQADVDLYTEEEKRLLSVRPGITDFSSIVFSDEGEILRGSEDPDLRYNQVIRPWKSRLGLLYIENSSLLLDIRLILLTVVAITSKQSALRGICAILKSLHADEALVQAAAREKPLEPFPPPGATAIATSR